MEHIENGAAEQQRLIITEQEAGQRADVGLAAMLELTRSNMQKLLEEGRAVRGSKVLKSNYKLRLGDEIDVTLPELQPLDDSRKIFLWILFMRMRMLLLSTKRAGW